MQRIDTNSIQSRLFHALCARALLKEVKLANTDYKASKFASAKSHYTNARNLMVLENIEDEISLREQEEARKRTAQHHTAADSDPTPLARCAENLIKGCSNHSLIDFDHINALAGQYTHCNSIDKLAHKNQRHLFGLLDKISKLPITKKTQINTEALFLLARKSELGAKYKYIETIARTGSDKAEDRISYNLVHKGRDANRKAFFTEGQEERFTHFINNVLFSLRTPGSIQMTHTNVDLSSVLTEENREVLELISKASMDYRPEPYMFFYPHQTILLFGPLDYQGTTMVSQIREFCASNDKPAATRVRAEQTS